MLFHADGGRGESRTLLIKAWDEFSDADWLRDAPRIRQLPTFPHLLASAALSS